MIIQGIPIIADLYMLPLEGCDIILGAQWLRTLEPIIWDFSKLFMQFKIDGNEVKLKGLAPLVDKIVDEQEIQKALNKEKDGAIVKYIFLLVSSPTR